MIRNYEIGVLFLPSRYRMTSFSPLFPHQLQEQQQKRQTKQQQQQQPKTNLETKGGSNNNNNNNSTKNSSNNANTNNNTVTYCCPPPYQLPLVPYSSGDKPCECFSYFCLSAFLLLTLSFPYPYALFISCLLCFFLSVSSLSSLVFFSHRSLIVFVFHFLCSLFLFPFSVAYFRALGRAI